MEFLKRRVCEDFIERLAGVQRRFDVALDLGARGGVFARMLESAGHDARIGWLVETDLAPAMLAGRGGPRVVADEERLPFAPASFDLVASSLAMHWVNDLVGSMIQIRRALRPDGLMLCAMLGGATLVELRRTLTETDLQETGGAGPRVSPFIDAPDAADLLRRAGFAMPVVDVDRLVVRYDHPLKLIADLRAMGESNALLERTRTPLTRRSLARTCQAYIDSFAGADGRIPATFEIVTMTGWAPDPGQPTAARRGSAKARLEDALDEIRRRRGEGQV